jgi:hypothetical protein
MRRLAILLFVACTLDIATSLMPGAFRFSPLTLP